MKIETWYNIAIVVAVAAIVAAFAASAAPTANEDYVDRQDARTYTNAVTDANAHADAAASAALSAANAYAIQAISSATSSIRKVDGAAKLLPRYLWALDFENAYTNDAAWYYAQADYQGGGHCSARRTGNLVERNFDWKFDRMAEVIVRMTAGPGRFASVGVANVGTNLTEDAITSGAHSRYFKCLPGHTVDGVNENGVVIEVNVTGGTWPRTSGAVHGLGAVRWALDHATNAQHAAEYLAANVYLPDGFGVNFHYLIADAEKTYIVENGDAIPMTGSPVVMTNFNLGEDGEGLERYQSLTNGASMVSQWWTAAYNRNTRPIRYSDLGTNYESIWDRWDQGTKESHRGEVVGGQTWWQTVHTSVYDMESRTLRICVQEIEDWYVFAVPSASDADLRRTVGAIAYSVSGLQSSKLDGPTDSTMTQSGKAADAKAVKEALAGKIDKSGDDMNGPLYFTNNQEVCVIKKYIPLSDEYFNFYPLEIDFVQDDRFEDTRDPIPLIASGPMVFADPTQEGYDEPSFMGYAWYNFGWDYVFLDMRRIPYNVSPAILAYTYEIEEATNALAKTIPAPYTPTATDPVFSNAVLSVATGISTNDWAVIASVADWASVIPGGVPTGAGTLGAVLAALAAAVLALKKKTSLLKSDGTAEDDFATNLMEKSVAITAVQNIVNGMFDNGDTTAYPRTTLEG